MERDEALSICRRAVALSRSDDVVASLTGQEQGATRFALNRIVQNVVQRRQRLTVRVAFGLRCGEVSVTRFDRESIQDAVNRAEEIAHVAPEDAEHLPPVEPGGFPEVPGAADATTGSTPDDRAGCVADAIGAAEAASTKTAGAFSTAGGFMAFANSRGAIGWHTHSGADVHATVLTGSSTGWAREIHRDRDRIDPKRAVERAGELASAAENPEETEPAEVPVVLAPSAVAELLAFFVFALDAKAADEERSAFTGRLGEKIAPDFVTLKSTLSSGAVPGYPFDSEGAPQRDVTWVEDGVLKSLRTTRYWAKKTNRPFTPYPGTLSMEGTDRSTEDLLREMGSGVYVTRFWYTRFVDPMTLLLTGMTRDAFFRVEGGKIVSGLKHLRYNDSPLRMLDNVKAIGRPEPARMMFVKGRIPPLLVSGFRFTSKTSF